MIAAQESMASTSLHWIYGRDERGFSADEKLVTAQSLEFMPTDSWATQSLQTSILIAT